jgi:hypothetical protein
VGEAAKAGLINGAPAPASGGGGGEGLGCAGGLGFWRYHLAGLPGSGRGGGGGRWTESGAHEWSTMD